jgi:hypothetical protein
MTRRVCSVVALLGLVLFSVPGRAASAPGQSAAMVLADPWPRAVRVADPTLRVYQPQVESWTGNTTTTGTASGA